MVKLKFSGFLFLSNFEENIHNRVFLGKEHIVVVLIERSLKI